MTNETKELIENCKWEIEIFERPSVGNSIRLIHALEQLQQRNAELERQRDELAAHLERADRCIEYTSTYLNEDKLNAIGSGSKAHQEMKDYLHKTPKQSLAEHDAEVARKACYTALKNMGSDKFELDEFEAFASEYAKKSATVRMVSDDTRAAGISTIKASPADAVSSHERAWCSAVRR